MNRFDYTRANSPDEAAALLAERTESQIIAGGTDLLPLMKEGIVTPARLVDISLWPKGHEIEQTKEGLEIGALVTLSELAQNAQIRERYTALSDACRLAAAPQLRNMGTIGGNLMQATRCVYYRGPYNCWLKGGERCYARKGENEQHSIFLTSLDQSISVSAHPSDPAAALLALDARVRYQTVLGTAEVSILDFYALPTDEHRSMVTIPSDAVITGVLLPSPPAKSLYRKAMPRATWSFALAGVALALDIEQGKITMARLGLSGVAPIPVRAEAVEQAMVGHPPAQLPTDELERLLVQDAQPLSQNGYKVQVLAGLFKEVLRDVAD
jgi:xanthine dehydrogenase YagS FAD-binding subunit